MSGQRTTVRQADGLSGYGHRPDGIKLMIAERSLMYAEKRLTSPQEAKELRRAAESAFDLEAIRTRHRAALARDRNEQEPKRAMLYTI
jgi:hypothetical protein